MRSRYKEIIIAIVVFFCGYLVGREHLKYQIRSAVGDGLEKMAEEMSNALDELRNTWDSVEISIDSVPTE